MLYLGCVTVCIQYSRFWTTLVRNPKLPPVPNIVHPKSLAARLCQSLGADAERRVVQLSFTGCFNFSAPDVLSGSQVVGVFNAAKSEENCQEFEM